MVRKKDPFWKYAQDKNKHFISKFCEKIFPSGASRLKSHLSRQIGRAITPCTNVPKDVQALAVIAIGDAGGSSRSFSKLKAPSQISSSATLGLQQTTIPGITHKKDKESVDLKVADHFFRNNIAFNVIQTTPFLAMIKAVAEFGVGYKPPSYSTLRTKLVDSSRQHVDGYVDQIKASWAKTGCSIMRLSNILHKVHAATAFLNPALMYDKKILSKQLDVREGLLFLGRKMLTLEERDELGELLLDIDDGRDEQVQNANNTNTNERRHGALGEFGDLSWLEDPVEGGPSISHLH
ncbi:hypothetical protein IFM89_026349 [Coptis chinensis]|uniref:Uncharacterized protein n=1 Tax=Coptis chinensis TaxID=261450 RepID=A0A835HMN8_9MAGN|nr:hypothetical protein IFM89_026349 [Coptis chinensis]